jgi:hypothetical protein
MVAIYSTNHAKKHHNGNNDNSDDDAGDIDRYVDNETKCDK